MTEWTTEPPTNCGYYWWRQGDRIEPCEVRVIYIDGDAEREVWFIGESDPLAEWQWQPDWQWMPAQPRRANND